MHKRSHLVGHIAYIGLYVVMIISTIILQFCRFSGITIRGMGNHGIWNDFSILFEQITGEGA